MMPDTIRSGLSARLVSVLCIFTRASHSSTDSANNHANDEIYDDKGKNK